MTHRLILFFLLLFEGFAVQAYTDTTKIPLNRQYFHDKINNAQLLFDKIDGQKDFAISITNNPEVNTKITDAVFRKTDDLQNRIELMDSSVNNNQRIRLLNYLENTLLQSRIAIRKKELDPCEIPELIERLEALFLHSFSKQAFIDQLKASSYTIAQILAMVYTDDKEDKEVSNIIYLKYCSLYPDKIITTIRNFASESFADSLMNEACKHNPSKLYTYAQSLNTIEGQLIHRSKYKLVQTIALISKTPKSLLYFPFLDDIISEKNSIEHIRKFVGTGDEDYDSIGYFKLLVKTELDYHNRMATTAKDTPVAMFGANGLRETLKDRAIRHFIIPINNLHEEKNLDVRMRSIDSLNAAEIFSVIVMGENDIFTSSFKHCFNRMLMRMGNKPKCDSLLLVMHFDFFKKFIKMAANYNKLDTFLKCMPSFKAQQLMRAFVSNLNKSNNLEDATDVADSYSSINNKELLTSMLKYVTDNEKQAILKNDQRASIIYGILKNIFLSTDTSKHIDLTSIAGISSVYDIDKKTLQDDSGRVVQQVFFYGDEDGKTYFNAFLNSFTSKQWKIVSKKEWVEIKSLQGKVLIFANKPLDYDANLDDTAQVHLNLYLEEQGLHPNIVIHRGHSYWLPGTINRMPEDAKIVILGSCGGYKNLQKIFEIAPDAHVISTKEIGAGDINKPIMNYLNQALLTDKKIVWRDMWRNLTKQFTFDPNPALKDTWENYIPPYRNLGALFIKAYNKKIESL